MCRELQNKTLHRRLHILYKQIDKPDDRTQLQDDLHRLAEWEKKWGMNFHPDKCNDRTITRSRSPITREYILKGHTLESTASSKYLGIEIQNDLSWNLHIDNTTKKVNSTIWFMKRNLRISNEKTKSSAYFSLIRPSLEYFSSVWNPYTREYIRTQSSHNDQADSATERGEATTCSDSKTASRSVGDQTEAVQSVPEHFKSPGIQSSHNDQADSATERGEATTCSDSKTSSRSVGDQTEAVQSVPEHFKSPDSSVSASEQGRWTADETRHLTDELFQSKTVHSLYNCSLKCDELSKGEIERLKPKKFSHSFINRKNWWLVFVEGEGMYCLVCKKHVMKHPQNNREVFSATPGVRFKHDAVNTHSSSKIHSDALTSDKFQKTSCFHQELLMKSELEYTHLEKAFSVAYFLMKEFIANRKFQPLLNFIESVSGDETLKYFRHQSEGAHQEIFHTIKTELLESVNKSLAYGLLTDEVSDISVSENLVTFIQFYCTETKKVETKFLSCQNILQDFESANAVAIKSLLAIEVEKLEQSTLTGFSSDGASVMTGKKGGVAALLRLENPSMVNIHCVCHRLALSCNDSNEALLYIKTVETLLRQLWQLFENSPKKMAAYLKVQLALKAMYLEGEKMAKVASRLKKACRTRWLSLDAAVSAVRLDFEAILQTLSQLEEKDAAAHGLLLKMKTLKFLGTIYILSDILPVLSELSRHFQQDSLNFSCILPAINQCKDKLQHIMESEEPLQKLAQDMTSFADMCSEIRPNVKSSNDLTNLLKNYVAGLINNIDRRFADTSAIVAAYGIFDPTTLPRSDEIDFKTHGDNQVALLADHFFFTDDVKKEKLAAQWNGFKYHVHDVLLPNMVCKAKEATPKYARGN